MNLPQRGEIANKAKRPLFNNPPIFARFAYLVYAAIVGPMEKQTDECPDISDFERLIDQNWNERKHLAEIEFDLRSEIQSLLQRGDSTEEFQKARARENECRVSLARNNSDYDALIDGWAAEAQKVSAEKLTV